MKKTLGKILLSASWIYLIATIFFGDIIGFSFSWRIFVALLIAGGILENAKEKVKIKNSLVKKLVQYFSSHEKLVYNEHIQFICKDKSCQGLEDIQVYYNEDKICTLNEFGQYYPNDYAAFINHLIPLMQIQAPIQEEKIETPIASELQAFINLINEYNILVEDETISMDLYKTVALLKQLDLLQTQYPKVSTKLNKLKEYYLPILCDILENYTRLSNTHSDSEELSLLEDKLRKSILLINEAIKNITSSLFEEEKMNLSADMNVLEALLKKDGLIEDEMNLEQLTAMMKE